MKILVIGFQRSGTTLLRKLIQMHPDVSCIIHEKRLLKQRNKKEIYNYVKNYKYCGKCNPEIDIWGEKVPFWIAKEQPMISYCLKWIDLFDDGKIIHIIRHPIDVAISNLKKKNIPAKTLDDTIMKYGKVYPRVLKTMSKISRMKNKQYIIIFEELVSSPRENLKNIFEFLNLNSSEDVLKKITSAKKDKLTYFDNINSERAFSYKKNDLQMINDIHYDIPDYIKMINYKGIL